MIQVFNRVPSKLSTIMVAFDAGAKAEGKKYQPGMAHMLEHMVFKGTSKRDYLQIPREIAFLGGAANAYTSHEEVVFYITVPFENVDAAMDILQDMVFNSTFPSDEFVKEREVVKEEEVSSRDDIGSFIWHSFSGNFYRGSRCATPVIGTQESICNFKLEDLKRFYSEFYKKDGAIVVLSGNHSKKDGKELLTKHFGEAKSRSFKLNAKPEKTSFADSREVVVHRPEIDHTHVWMGYPSSPIGSENSAADNIMMSILGGGMDSRLFVEVRDKNALCYGIGVDQHKGRDYSSVIIESSTREENIEKMKSLINLELEKIRTELVSDEELERAKNKYRSTTYAVLEGSSRSARHALRTKFYKLPSIDELSRRVSEVTAQDVMDSANRIFDDGKRMTLICRKGIN